MEEQEIRTLIAKGFPDAKITVVDIVGDKNHYQVKVISPLFEGKSLLEQHKMVYSCFGELLGDALHALSIVTAVKE